MKNSDGQLYTIEGFAAALIMLITAYLVVNATSVYTAGDTHISDMQLEALGTDALKVMAVPESHEGESLMQEIIVATPPGVNNHTFGSNFSYLINNKTSGNDHIQFMANVSYFDIFNSTTENYLISASRNISIGEHAVRATKWVIVKKKLPGDPSASPQDRAVLVEVLMWRD